MTHGSNVEVERMCVGRRRCYSCSSCGACYENCGCGCDSPRVVLNNSEIEMAQRAVEAAQARLDRLLVEDAEYQVMLAKLQEACENSRNIEEPTPTVIQFDRTSNGRTYTYSAVMVHHKWFLTGSRPRKGYSYEELARWLVEGGVTTVWQVAEVFEL